MLLCYLVVVVFIFSFQSSYSGKSFNLPNGDDEIRTRDPLLARQVLSQLSYAPIAIVYELASKHCMKIGEKRKWIFAS